MCGKRIEEEKKTVEKMIHIYCKKHEKNEEICPTCKELLDYALIRLSKCRFGEDKKTCKQCPTHCYKPVMREKMKEVMKFSGPRMLIYDPIAAIRHLIREL